MKTSEMSDYNNCKNDAPDPKGGEIVCGNCGCNVVELKLNGLHVVAYCCRCGLYIKNVPKDEVLINVTNQTARFIKEEMTEDDSKLKQYRISGLIKAKPMTRMEYVIKRGWMLPEDENGSDDGYFIIHETGTVSWMIDEDFERLIYGVQY